jgi:alkylation response protein AidB-like acyl-CoA dehydrogenase
MVTKEIAKADLSLARCWEGHANSLVILDGMASAAQKEKWFEGVVRRGEKWVAWSGEPQAPALDEGRRFGTLVKSVEAGYLIEGTKVFSTSAGGAQWAILLVNTKGPGGARHATGAPENLLLLACDLSDQTVQIDTSWWDPIGMRATASHLVHFRKTFIPASNLIGWPGQYLSEGWQTYFTPHYAASFLGAAEAAYDYGLDYLNNQNRSGDPYVQHHIAKMHINVETSHLWLQYVARLWNSSESEEAKLAGSHARYLIERLAEDTIKHCIKACGARCLLRPSPLERIYRDLSLYVRHDNVDQILSVIGKAILGQPYDASFYKP